jgi:hypothetical protein
MHESKGARALQRDAAGREAALAGARPAQPGLGDIMSENTFYLGLTMAGAISAGAYNGGAFDLLMEALEAWEKQRGQPDIPSHRVVIPVMSGASAGGITGALGLIALADGAPPKTDAANAVLATLPRLYKAWVELPTFTPDPVAGGAALLNTEDLKKLGPKDSVTALLDTTILTEIAEAVLQPMNVQHSPRPYLSQTLDLFLTHTNLRGVPYRITFTSGQGTPAGYDMLSHGDRVHYAVQGIGTAGFTSIWATPETSRPLNATAIPADALKTPVWGAFAQAVLGTSAFPLALTARKIEQVTMLDYQTRQWPLKGTHHPANPSLPPKFTLQPHFPPSIGDNPANPVNYVTLDGGMIDNEPFELARWTLMKNPPHPNERTLADVDRAVLMIDPFPEPPEYDLTGKLDSALRMVIGRLLPTFMNQARFKLDALADALDDDIYTRYLIVPRRRDKTTKALEYNTIACGLLGGFGGFLDVRFREHDYQLGRYNAYHFLKDSFAMPLTNAVLKAGYGTAPSPQFQTPSNPNDYQIIPLLVSEPQVPDWPQVDRDIVERMVKAAKKRAGAVFDQIKAGTGSRITRWVAAVAWYFGKDRLETYIRWAVLQDLIARDQYSGTQDKPWAGSGSVLGVGTGAGTALLFGGIKLKHVHMTLSALADPAWDFRTAGGIAMQHVLHGLTTSDVITILHHPSFKDVVAQGRATAAGLPTYTLAERKPGWFSQLPGVRQIGEYFSGDPTID